MLPGCPLKIVFDNTTDILLISGMIIYKHKTYKLIFYISYKHYNLNTI